MRRLRTTTIQKAKDVFCYMFLLSYLSPAWLNLRSTATVLHTAFLWFLKACFTADIFLGRFCTLNISQKHALLKKVTLVTQLTLVPCREWREQRILQAQHGTRVCENPKFSRLLKPVIHFPVLTRTPNYRFISAFSCHWCLVR